MTPPDLGATYLPEALGYIRILTARVARLRRRLAAMREEDWQGGVSCLCCAPKELAR